MHLFRKNGNTQIFNIFCCRLRVSSVMSEMRETSSFLIGNSKANFFLNKYFFHELFFLTEELLSSQERMKDKNRFLTPNTPLIQKIPHGKGREWPRWYPEVGGLIPGAGNLKNSFLDISSWLLTNKDFTGLGLSSKTQLNWESQQGRDRAMSGGNKKE